MNQKPLSDTNIGSLCRNLGHMLHAGIGLTESVCLLPEDTWQDSRTPAVLTEALDLGLPLSEAMAAAEVFPPAVSALVRIGEETGRLEEALFSLADYYDRRHRTNRLAQNAIAYPAITLLLMLVVAGVLLVKVLPIFDGVYASLGSRLTGVAATLLHMGSWLKHALPGLFVLMAAFLILAVCFAKWPAFRTILLGSYRKLFADRGISRKFNNARFAQGLAMSLGSGMHPEEAVSLAAMLMGDSSGASRCRSCSEKLASGTDLSEALEESGLLNPASCRMLAIGIRSGSADTVMADIAQKLMEQAEEALETAIARVEPAMVLSASLLVGLILLSVMVPLMDILSVLG